MPSTSPMAALLGASVLTLLAALPAHAQTVQASGSVSPFPNPNPRPSWEFSPALLVGQNGTGSLLISDGGWIWHAGYGSIGVNVGRSGSVTLSGENSEWATDQNIYIGEAGSGILTIQNGASVTTNAGATSYLGEKSGASGTVHVIGHGANWSNGALSIGHSGTGVLNIQDGGAIASAVGFSYIGNNSGSNGTVTVDGEGSRWISGGNLDIGRLGSGSLVIQNGGVVSSSGGSHIGQSSGSVGNVTVSGLDSSWSTSSRTYTPFLGSTVFSTRLRIGENGTGTLRIEDGGTVSNAGGSTIHADSTATVTGENSRWNLSPAYRRSGQNSQTLIHGLSVEPFGSLTVSEGGSIVTTGGGTVNGHAVINGAGTSWLLRRTNISGIGLLREGILRVTEGNLSIEAGGTVAVGETTNLMPTIIGANGQLRVSGAESALHTLGDINLVPHGNLTVENGGEVSTRTLIASLSDLHGDGTISATGALLDADLVFDSNTGPEASVAFGNGGQLQINLDGTAMLGAGYAGVGSVQISDGITVASTGFSLIGDQAGSVGSVSVTGIDSTWTHSGEVTVGRFGVGTLTIENGARLLPSAGASLRGYIGRYPGSEGSVTVSGADSRWTTTWDLSVGESGSASLVIADGGTVENSTGLVGQSSQGSADVTVTGTGSLWTNKGSLQIGQYGQGQLAVADGGMVWVGGTLAIYSGDEVILDGGTIRFNGYSRDPMGTFDYRSGTIQLAGNRSLASDPVINEFFGASPVLESGYGLTIEGTATLDIPLMLAGGTFDVGGLDPLAQLSFSSGTLINRGAMSGGLSLPDSSSTTITGTGSSWHNSGNLVLGGNGMAELFIADGGQVSSATAALGGNEDGKGSAFVSGADSQWAISNNLLVGSYGTGELTIANGGSVTNAVGYIGYFAGSESSVSVSGAGSQWTNDGSLEIGSFGSGELTISEGGQVSNVYGSIGRQFGSSGVVTVTGAGAQWINAWLDVGTAGSGELIIANGGSVESGGGGYVGGSISAATGKVTVSGTGSGWNMLGLELIIGSAGSGEMLIADGGSVSNGNSIIGRFNGSAGSVRVTGENATWTNTGNLVLGGTRLGNQTSATGHLIVDDGGAVSIGGTTRVHGGGSVSIESGSTLESQLFHVSGEVAIAGMLSAVDGVTIDAGGRIGGGGAVEGNVTLGAGALWRFEADQTLTVSGDVVLDASFGIASLVGLDSSIAVGTYTLIDGSSTNFSLLGIQNWGLANAYDLGESKKAFFKQGSLQVEVVLDTPFKMWTEQFPGLANTDPALDFDGGGLPTALEWVLGGNPTDPNDDVGIMPTIDAISDPDGKLLFIFRRTAAAAADPLTTVIVEYGNDLNGWTAATHAGFAADEIAITEEADGFAANIDRVTVALPSNLAPNGRLFVRLNVGVD